MLYLEDYLEMIEHLPQELRDRFTEMRELDLTVQNNMDSLEKKTRYFFLQCKRGELHPDDFEFHFQNMRREYYKVLEDADEKVTIATQIHELVERYLRRLDSELFKFKCELEADNNGITEILERRSLELDSGSTIASSLIDVMNVNQKENHYYGSLVPPLATHSHAIRMSAPNVYSHTAQHLTHPPPLVPKEPRYRAPRPEKRRESLNTTTLGIIPEKRHNLSGNIPTPAVAAAAAAAAASATATTSVATNTMNVVRPLPAGLTARPMLNAVAATVAAPVNAGTVTYNLQQLSGSNASNAIVAAASQAIVATQQMQQGRRTASLKASFEAFQCGTGNNTEFWMNRDLTNAAAASHATLHATNTVEKKHKNRKVNTHAAGTGGVVVTNNQMAPTNISLGSSSSSISVDSIDLKTPIPGLTTTANIQTLGLTNIGGGATNIAIVHRANANTIQTTPNQTILNQTIVNPAVVSQAVINQTVVNPTVINQAVVNQTITNQATLNTNATLSNLNENGVMIEQQTIEGDWIYDPNEPRYCTCNQVSYGDMVACDNDACPFEWFHYPCVGITQPPKGKWYCPKCTASMRRRHRKN